MQHSNLIGIVIELEAHFPSLQTEYASTPSSWGSCSSQLCNSGCAPVRHSSDICFHIGCFTSAPACPNWMSHSTIWVSPCSLRSHLIQGNLAPW